MVPCVVAGVGSEDSEPADTWRRSDVADGEGEGEGTPCLRLVVTESDKLNTGTVFIVTRIGADIGRCVCVRECMRTSMGICLTCWLGAPLQ